VAATFETYFGYEMIALNPITWRIELADERNIFALCYGGADGP
jgi:hypothetical protein